MLISRKDGDTEGLGCPALSNATQWHPSNFAERAIKSLRKRSQGFFEPVVPSVERRRIRRFLEDHKVQAVLAEYGPTGCLLMRTCSEAGVPLYVHFHGFDASRDLRHKDRVRHYQALFKRAAGVIVPSRYLGDRLIAVGCPRAKLHKSYNGIDVSRFQPTMRHPNRIVAIGRLVEKKAPHLTISAFGKLRAMFPDARLDMVGDGPLAERCMTLVNDLALSDCVTLHGAKSRSFVAELLSTASLFVQHSVTAPNGDTESFGISLVEAMACSVPVVVTKHNGFVETVQDGITGLLITEHDVDGMAGAMAELLNNPSRAAAMGEAGRARVLANFTLTQARDRLRDIMGFPPCTEAA